MPPIALLGPQRLRTTLPAAIERMGLDGRIATITAGWEERELEDDELAAHLRGRAVNLRLARRTEAVHLKDPDLLRETLGLFDRRKLIDELYRTRLGYALEAARDLLGRSSDSAWLPREQVAAIEAVRAIDNGHLEAVRELEREFVERLHPEQHPEVLRHREEIGATIDGCAGLAIAGGHVGVLLGLLRLYRILDLIGHRPVIAWSAGAMVLGTRIVLFHDSPPQGAGNAEVHNTGLALVEGVLPLPHAHRRLRLNDRLRVGLLARRFAPLRCAAMADGAQLVIDDGRVTHCDGIRQLEADGTVRDGCAVFTGAAR